MSVFNDEWTPTMNWDILNEHPLTALKVWLPDYASKTDVAGGKQDL